LLQINYKIFLLFALTVPLTFVPLPAQAVDAEGCLLCHRYRGLSQLDAETGELRLFFCSSEYYAYQMGPHARLNCTDCHLREEVSVFPHKVKTPVDCSTQCHLTASGRVEILFSHRPMIEALEQSVHSVEMLSQLEFSPPLLREGQSNCLYCHDEPLFRYTVNDPGGKDARRCQTCHAEEVPIDMEYFIQHTASRMQPARPTRQLIQMCAVCHSDPEVLARTDEHDPIASYLHSFHGKANMLGSTETATCLDCHASETGNPHAMLSKDDPESTTHVSQVSETCRSARCHISASPGMSSASVHLPLDPQARTPEFYVAAFFIILTAATLSLFFLILALDLLGMVVKKQDPDEHRLATLARKIQADPEHRKKLLRLTTHQRFQHWLLAITFSGLVYTGMCIKFADAPWAATLVNLVGGLTISRHIHRICGVIMLTGFGYHILYLIVHFVCLRRRLRREGSTESLVQTILKAPMMITLTDITDVVRFLLYLFKVRPHRPQFKRFGFMEKFEYWAVFWGCLMIGASGAMLWATEWISAHLSGRALNFAYIIHSDEAYLAFVYIAVVHLFSVIFSPVVFPLSLGSLSGYAPPDEMAEKHSFVVEQAAGEFNLTAEVPHQDKLTFIEILRQILRRSYAGILLVSLIMIWVVSLQYLIHNLITRQTAPTEIVEIPKRLDELVLLEQPHDLALTGGVTEPLTRGPLAHFHQIPPWFQSDPTGGCTVSGCHYQVPHGKRVETRAFLNMHATFLDCGLCHTERVIQTPQTGWFELHDGKRSAIPAVLRLVSYLERTELSAPDQANDINDQLILLLNQALIEAGENEQLRAWLVHLETTTPQSKLWDYIIEDIQEGIRLHLHGEYAAKIAVDQGEQRPGMNSLQKQATKEYLKNLEQLSTEQSEKLLDEIHQGISPEGQICTPCHNSDLPMLDFGALGYSPQRIEALQDSPIARQMQQIQEGKEFIIDTHPDVIIRN